MELEGYVNNLREQLAVAASAGGEEALSLAQRLTAALESAVRLTLLDALSAAAAEITGELAPGSVELRLRGGEPEFVVTVPPAETAGEQTDSRELTARWPDAYRYKLEQSLQVAAWLEHGEDHTDAFSREPKT